MATKNPKLEKLEKDFDDLEKIINFEIIKKTKRVEKIFELLKLYSIDPYSSCVEFYKFYKLNTRNYQESNIISNLKSLIRDYSKKVIKFEKELVKKPSLFKIS